MGSTKLDPGRPDSRWRVLRTLRSTRHLPAIIVTGRNDETGLTDPMMRLVDQRGDLEPGMVGSRSTAASASAS